MRIQRYNIAKTFGIPADPSKEVLGFSDDQHALVPPRNNEYVFDRGVLRDLISFLTDPYGDSLYLVGPTGCGKTSVINQTACRLCWPTTNMTAHGRLQVADLVGRMMLIDNGQGQAIMTYQLGPLALAMEKGYLFILNEMDLMDPSEVSGLNDLLEGGALTIPETGQVIRPHPEFRFLATGNSNGAGDMTGGYQGVLTQNLAPMDRFRMTEVAYQAPEDEVEIINKAVPSLAKAAPLAERMVSLANRIRQAFVTGVGDTNLSVTMSTRTLLRWAHMIPKFEDAPESLNVLHYTLNRALLFRTEPAQQEAIVRMAKDVFGKAWKGDAA